MSIQIQKSYGKVQFISKPSRLQKYGVPIGGPLDPYTPQIVRAALNVDPQAPLIEVMGSVTFEAKIPMSICWMTPQEGYVKKLKKWDVCTITCMGSFAGYLGFAAHKVPDQNLKGLHQPSSILRYVPMELNEHFEAKSTLDASRIGFKFESELEATSVQRESEPACAGLIQQTPSGQIIVLGPDGPVTGGYRKLGAIIQADFSALAMLRMQHSYEFIPVSYDEAKRSRHEKLASVKNQCDLLRVLQKSEPFPEF